MKIPSRIVRRSEVSSTNDVLKELAKNGEPEGVVLIAASQTHGRGRMGRAWTSPEGGLYFSILLRPDLKAKALLRMTVYSCVPFAEAVEAVTGARVEVKWPNDLEIEGKKVGGILVEGVSKLNRIDSVIIGIGINANAPVPPNLSEAASLSEILRREIDLDELLTECLRRFDGFYSDFVKGEFPEDEYKKRSSVLGAEVEARMGNQSITGKALHVNKDGSLTIRTDEGPLIRLGWVSDTTLRVVAPRAEPRKDYYRKHNSFR